MNEFDTPEKLRASTTGGAKYGPVSASDNKLQAAVCGQAFGPDGRVGAQAMHLAVQTFRGRYVDPDVVVQVAQTLERELGKARLGCATTGELLDELRARSDLGYRTVTSC